MHEILFPWLSKLLLMSKDNRTGQSMVIGNFGASIWLDIKSKFCMTHDAEVV